MRPEFDDQKDEGFRPAGPAGGGTPPPPSNDGEAKVEQDLDALVADAHRERDEYLELAKRTKADFENFRKRMAGEVSAASLRGKAEVAREVTPVLDDLERAIEVAGLDPEGDSEDGLAHGVLLVFRGLRDALGRAGVEAVDPKGERFDPMAHEALSTLKVEGTESGGLFGLLARLVEKAIVARS